VQDVGVKSRKEIEKVVEEVSKEVQSTEDIKRK
jgi:hypothetical protein